MVLAAMSSLVRTGDSEMAYSIAACQRQTVGSNDCGLFVIAFSVSLAFGENLCTRLYDSSLNRDHLKKCFEEQKMSKFPSFEQKFTRKSIASESLSFPVYCNGRRTDNVYARNMLQNKIWDMIQSDDCDEYFHRMCENYRKNTKLQWFCKSCNSVKNLKPT